jgi:catalase
VNYEPNRFGDFAQDANASEPPLAAGTVDRYGHRLDADYYTQPGMLFALFDAAQRERLFGNIARHISGVPPEIVARQIEHFRRADPAYAEGVIAAMADLAERNRK